MGIQLKNNAYSTLASSITASNTGIVVATNEGSRFPTLGATDYFYATLESTGGTTEIVKVTARSGDTMTIVRAQEGTSAQSFLAGSRIELRVTVSNVEGGTYTPDGASAVARTLQTKLRDIVSVKDFGALGDGTTNDYQAIQNAIDYLVSVGGGKLTCENGKTYAMTTAPQIKNNVEVDMCGATWNMTLGSGNAYGVRIGTSSGVENGTINVISTGTPGNQGIFHAAISIGEAYGEGTIANPGYYQFASNWFVRNMTLHTTRNNTPVLQGLGGLSNGIIENITIPDSVTCSGIHFDWGTVGPVSAANIPATRIAYDAGQCYTTHPNNITIRNINVGNLSFPLSAPDIGTRAVRLSACHGITVENVTVAGTTYAAYNHIGGDLGYEFAQPSVRPFACRGNSVRNFQANNSGQFGAYIDSYADNVAAAVSGGYSPLFNTIMQADITIDQFTTVGLGLNSVEDGIRLEFVNGVFVKDANCYNHNYGMYIDQKAQNINVLRGNYYYNQRDGLSVRDNADTRYIVLDSVQAQRNGLYASWTTKSGINIAGGNSIKIENCFVGSTDEDYQNVGIRVQSAAQDVVVVNNVCREVVSGGVAFVMAADGVYTAITVFNGNKYQGSAGTAYGGQRIVPFASIYDPTNNVLIRQWVAGRVFLSSDTTPPSGTWVANDRIFYSSGSAAGGYTGTVCITGGTPGTWKRFGAAEA